jgi:hypothetical protein
MNNETEPTSLPLAKIIKAIESMIVVDQDMCEQSLNNEDCWDYAVDRNNTNLKWCPKINLQTLTKCQSSDKLLY